MALLPGASAVVNAGGLQFTELEGALAAALAPWYAAAADDAAFDEPIRQSMAEAFAAAGGGVGTPAMVLYEDPPVGFHALASIPTADLAARLARRKDQGNCHGDERVLER